MRCLLISLTCMTVILAIATVEATAVPMPTHHWKFDETSGITAADSGTTGGLDLMLVNFPFDDSAWGIAGPATLPTYGLEFDAVDDEATAPGAPHLFQDAEHSITAWVRHDTLATNQRFISWRDTVEGGGRYFAGLAIYGTPEWDGIYGSVGTTSWSPGPTMPTGGGEWDHIALVGDVSPDGLSITLELYLNGVASGAPVTEPVSATPMGSEPTLFVGRQSWPDPDDERLDGAVADLAYYDVALSEEYVNYIMNNGAGVEGPVIGDLDDDGFVGASDVDVLRTFWGQSVTPGDVLSGDPSGDGFCGVDDFDVVRDNWGQGTPPAEGALGVPEPGSLALVVLGALVLLVSRCRYRI